MQVIWLLVPNLVWPRHCRPPRRPLLRALGVRVRRLLLWLEELHPCLSNDLAPILLHIFEALSVDLIAGGVVADGDRPGGKGRDGALTGACSSSAATLAGSRAHGGVGGVVIIGAVRAGRSAVAVRRADSVDEAAFALKSPPLCVEFSLEHRFWGAELVVTVGLDDWDVRDGWRPEANRSSLWKAGVKRNLGSVLKSSERKVAIWPSGRITARAYVVDSMPQYSFRAMLIACSTLGLVH